MGYNMFVGYGICTHRRKGSKRDKRALRSLNFISIRVFILQIVTRSGFADWIYQGGQISVFTRSGFHMDSEHASRENKSTMLIFLILVHKNVYRIYRGGKFLPRTTNYQLLSEINSCDRTTKLPAIVTNFLRWFLIEIILETVFPWLWVLLTSLVQQ